MSELLPPTGEIVQPTAPVTPPVVQPTEEVHPAVQRINEDKAKLQQQVDDLQRQLKEKELSALPEDQQIEEGFREMYSEKVLNGFPAADLAKLPRVIQDQLKLNPWAFTSQADIDQAGNGADSAKDYYSKVAKVATATIKHLIEESGGTAAPEQNPTKDPSLPMGGSPTTEPGSYSEGQLRVMAMTDPAKFQQVMSAAQGK